MNQMSASHDCGAVEFNRRKCNFRKGNFSENHNRIQSNNRFKFLLNSIFKKLENYPMTKTKILLSFITAFITCTLLYSQQLKLHVDGLQSSTAALYSISGEKSAFVDSIASTNSLFSYSFDKTKSITGLYRITFNKNMGFNFIYDGNDIELETHVNNLDSIKVVKSESNRLYYDFINLNKIYKTKTDILQFVIANYPKDDPYYNSTIEKVYQIQNEYWNFITRAPIKLPGSFISRYIRSTQLPVIDVSLSLDEQIKYLKAHALDNVDFSDAGLIYSDCFTNKSIEYLTYYRNPNFSKEILEKEFMKAVDTLLTKASAHQLVYQHIADYLINGFKQFGFDKLVDFIIENYVIKDDLCLDESTENSIENRINQSKLLSIGTKAPSISMPNEKGQLYELDKIISNKILLIFYASWCPHCKEIVPEISKIYDNRKDFEVLAISLDEKKEEWLKFIEDNNLNWLNLSDLKGWNSKAAQDYYIYATPTMFLLDAQKKIIGKPLTVNELKDLL